MGIIKGIDVILIQKSAGPADPFGNPTYTEESITVKNVLVKPIEVGTDDAAESTKLEGRSLVYELSIPKNDNHAWENAGVVVFGERFETVGSPRRYISHLTPLDWDRKIKVCRYE